MKQIIALIFIYCLQSYGQQMFVDAPSGLIVRNAPVKTANRIGKFDFGTQIEIITKTNKKLVIEDDGISIEGEWMEVHEPTTNISGYVFSGFLSSNKSSSYGYYLTNIKENTAESFFNVVTNQTELKPSYISLKNINNKKQIEFKIVDIETYDGRDLYVIDLRGLKNIKQLIKVDINYSACCSNTEEYYYLENSKGKLIKLPLIQNVHCDGPEPYKDYIFPNDKFGQKNKILYAEITPNMKGDEISIEVLKVYSWNGNKIKQIK